MANPVWNLSVNLETKTAVFQTGLADAARAARSSFGEIKDSANDMSTGVAEASSRTEYSMTEARHGVVMLGEEFGVRLPRGLTTFIASLGPVGAAMEAAFPFLAIILGATLLIEHLDKLKGKSEELTAAQSKFADDAAEMYDKLGNRLLQVGIRADRLAGNNLAALQKQLMLIDRQTMSDIIGELDKLGKDADDAFSKLESGWFMQLMMGRADVSPAKAELASMIAEINRLKGTGVDPGNATRALLGTDADAVKEQIDAIENKVRELRALQTGGGAGDEIESAANERKINELEQQRALYQQNLDTLRTMQGVAGQSVDVGSGEKKNDAVAEARKEAKAVEEAKQKEARAAEKMYDDIQRRRIEYEDAVMEMNEKENKDAEALFKATEERNAQAADSKIAQDEKEAKEGEELFNTIQKQNAEAADAALEWAKANSAWSVYFNHVNQ